MKQHSSTKIDGNTALEFLACNQVEIYTEKQGIIKGDPKELLRKYAQGDDYKAKRFFDAVIRYIPQGRVLYFDTTTNRWEVFKASLADYH